MNNKTIYWPNAVVFSLIIALVSCGGGGDGEIASNSRPTATITSPTDGSTFTLYDTTSFSGTGQDAEDGTLSGDSLVWTSSRDDQIGTGTSFARADLSRGSHTITLTVTDSKGDTGSDTVSITISPFPINVSGRVLFNNGNPVEGATVTASAVSEESIATVRALWRASQVDWTKPDAQGKKQSLKIQTTPIFLQVLQSVNTVTDASGNYALVLPTDVLPVRALIEVSFQSDSLPVVRSSRWGDADSDTLVMGDIAIPAVENTEISIPDGSGQNNDGSIQVEGLPAEVDRFFALSFDPEVNPEAFPGEFAEMGAIPLNSSVFAWMEGLDSEGNPVQDLSQAATIRSRVPQSQWSDLEDINLGTDRIEIPIYIYNENIEMWEERAEVGWLEDEFGTVLPEDAQPTILDGTFSGEIFATYITDHFSWMNVDYAYIGPWTLSRLDPAKRNSDCLYKALQLAKTIAKSQKGRDAYAKVNKPDGDLDVELADGAGPELKTFSPANAQEYGVYRGDSGGSESDVFINTRMWDFCTDESSESQKKAATLMMALTILHESAHWKDDVKKHPNAGDRTPPDGPKDTAGEEGWELERDIFEKDLFLNDDGTVREGRADGAEVSQEQIDNWLNTDNWPPAPSGSSISTRTLSIQQTAQSPLQLTISLLRDTFDLGEEIPVTVTYTNISGQAISVFNLLILEDYPIRFDMLHMDTGKTVGFLGPERKLGFLSTDFVTLNPGETLTKTVDINRDEDGNLNRYNLRLSGNYEIKAAYSSFFGLPETESNTLAFAISPGGSISGTVTDASTGNFISGATVNAIQNDNVVAAAATGDDGTYTIPELPGGTYIVEGRAPGFLRSTQENIVVTLGLDTTVNFSLSPLLSVGQLRLVLAWGELPYDLDSHLWLPVEKPFHLYYARRGSPVVCPFAELDVDDTSSFGPETITIDQLFTGIYRYAIYNYSGSPAIITSQAQVQVLDSTGLIATFNIPTEGEGLWWHVMDINGDTGAITEVNQVTSANPELYSDTDQGCQSTAITWFNQVATDNPELYFDTDSGNQPRISPTIHLYLFPVYCLFMLQLRYRK